MVYIDDRKKNYKSILLEFTDDDDDDEFSFSLIRTIDLICSVPWWSSPGSQEVTTEKKNNFLLLFFLSKINK
mgnify:CR=1 FL=1